MTTSRKLGRTSEKLLGIWQNRWGRLLVIWVLLAGLGGAGWWAKGKLERRQSRKLTAMAVEYMREGKGEEARMGLSAALQLNPRNAEALRAMARLRLAQGANAEALDAMRHLMESGHLSFADLTAYATLAAREGDSALADRLVNSAARGGNKVLWHILRAQVCEAQNDPEGAEKELRAALEEDETGEAGMVLARFLTSRRLNAETAPEVLEILRRISEKKSSMGAEALALGISSGVVPPTEVEGWISSLRNHPEVNERGRLLADVAEIRLRPDTKSQVLERVAKRLQGQPLGERIQGMALAMQVAEPEVALSLITPNEAASDVRIFQSWLDALAMQNRWPEILAALSREGQPLPETRKALYTGRALVAQGKTVEGQRAYGQALEGAARNRGDFIMAVA